MTRDQILEELKELCDQLGYRLRIENGDFQGGACVLKDERMLLINKRLPSERKIHLLATALHEIGLDSVFIKPAVRKVIETETTRKA